MKPENQVCNLELSKRLKELGAKQKSYFFWTGWHSRPSLYTSSTFRSSQLDDSFSAFTVAELGEMLRDIASRIDCGDVCYDLSFENVKPTIGWGGDGHEEIAETEANARAKMLIYLLENKLIESPASEEEK